MEGEGRFGVRSGMAAEGSGSKTSSSIAAVQARCSRKSVSPAKLSLMTLPWRVESAWTTEMLAKATDAMQSQQRRSRVSKAGLGSLGRLAWYLLATSCKI